MNISFLGTISRSEGYRTVRTMAGVMTSMALLFGAAGCYSPDGGPGGARAQAGAKAPTLEDQVKDIENNPKMSPQAKQAVLANMRASYVQRGKPVPAALQPKEMSN